MTEKKSYKRRTGEEIKQAVKEKGLTEFSPFQCSICKSYHGYIFDGEVVYRNSSCGCAFSTPYVIEWDNLANHYNLNVNWNGIKEWAEHFGFEE